MPMFLWGYWVLRDHVDSFFLVRGYYVVLTCATGVVHVRLEWSGFASASVDLCHEFTVGAAGSS